MIIKCKICGGDIEYSAEKSYWICEYCGTKQTLPHIDDDKKALIYNRINRYRLNNEYDKAMALCEQLVIDDSTEAECYWLIVLCRYGVEYVEDPHTHRHIPTINRLRYTSILEDEDYQNALKFADSDQIEIYREDAALISKIQQGILSISKTEKAFDIFICYKEADENGNRTADSVIANKLYDLLTEKGYRVFYSRITLEDKLGTAYEPYIFAALNSAKVMIVLGTKPEYYNAVWVRNEWSRYLTLIKEGAEKVLIPAYRDMDAKNLPQEFSYLQALDLSKIGFEQDLLHGIRKYCAADEKSSGRDSSLQDTITNKAYELLEKGEFADASQSINTLLGLDPTDAKALIAKFMLDQKIKALGDLATEDILLQENSVFQKAEKTATSAFAEQLKQIKSDNTYYHAQRWANTKSVKKLKKANSLFSQFDETEDILTQKALCQKRIKHRKSVRTVKIILAIIAIILGLFFSYLYIDTQYNKALESIKQYDYEKAAEMLSVISFYKDSATVKTECEYKIEKREKFRNADAGTTLFFGQYEQDNNKANGKEDIEWVVLEREDNSLLMVSKYALDCQPYNNTNEEVTWENCSLRTWLNEDFFENAFSAEEKEKIPETAVPADKNPNANSHSGNATNDKIFLLSIKEANRYFFKKTALMCASTAYAEAQGTNASENCKTESGEASCCWWLRSPGTFDNFATFVSIDGAVSYYGNYVYFNHYAVRPALWINLE